MKFFAQMDTHEFKYLGDFCTDDSYGSAFTAAAEHADALYPNYHWIFDEGGLRETIDNAKAALEAA
jgi:hypothetical protein